MSHRLEEYEIRLEESEEIIKSKDAYCEKLIGQIELLTKENEKKRRSNELSPLSVNKNHQNIPKKGENYMFSSIPDLKKEKEAQNLMISQTKFGNKGLLDSTKMKNIERELKRKKEWIEVLTELINLKEKDLKTLKKNIKEMKTEYEVKLKRVEEKVLNYLEDRSRIQQQLVQTFGKSTLIPRNNTRIDTDHELPIRIQENFDPMRAKASIEYSRKAEGDGLGFLYRSVERTKAWSSIFNLKNSIQIRNTVENADGEEQTIFQEMFGMGHGNFNVGFSMEDSFFRRSVGKSGSTIKRVRGGNKVNNFELGDFELGINESNEIFDN